VQGGKKSAVDIDSSSTPVSVVGTSGTVTVGDGSLASIGGPVIGSAISGRW